MNIRDIINRRRRALGWSMYLIVQKSGLKASTVYEYLGGDREIRSDNLETLLMTLGLTISIDLSEDARRRLCQSDAAPDA